MTSCPSISVLLVEDFAPIRHRMSSLISGHPGIEVVGEAADAAGALRQFALCRPDVVVLDIQLPDGSGIDVLRTIKASSPDCVVIMLTSHADEAYREACQRAGADHFFQKETEFEKVPATIEASRLDSRP